MDRANGRPGSRLPIGLPDPVDHHRRQRAHAAAAVEAAASRLLEVASVSGAKVVLREPAGGPLIDEEVPFAGGAPPAVGDLVARLLLPGRGRKAAGGAAVAVGPIGRLPGPDVSDTPQVLTASQSGADATSTSSTSVYATALTVGMPLPAGNWAVFLVGGLCLEHSASQAADFRLTIDGNAGTGRFTPNLQGTNFSMFVDDHGVWPVAGGRTITLVVEYKSRNTGTTSAANPWLMALASRG